MLLGVMHRRRPLAPTSRVARAALTPNLLGRVCLRCRRLQSIHVHTCQAELPGAVTVMRRPHGCWPAYGTSRFGRMAEGKIRGIDAVPEAPVRPASSTSWHGRRMLSGEELCLDRFVAVLEAVSDERSEFLGRDNRRLAYFVPSRQKRLRRRLFTARQLWQSGRTLQFHQRLAVGALQLGDPPTRNLQEPPHAEHLVAGPHEGVPLFRHYATIVVGVDVLQ
mmetsp:Transcript_11680/g.31419  ORF Transcript_11680/g.31419 Transcript_11680/m.31419 type:complete len:221 (+) Transcript_11680:1461-2123(+)